MNAIVNFRHLELSTKLNRVNLQYDNELLDATTFGPSKTTRNRLKGLKNVVADVQGFYDTAQNVAGTLPERVDKGLIDKLADLNPGYVTIGPNGNAGGDTAYFFNALQGEFNPGGGVGDIMAMSASFQGNSELFKGYYGLVGSYTAAASSTGVNAGALSSTQKLNFVCHLLTLEGTASRTVTLVVESDDNSGFTTPVTRATLGPYINTTVFDSYYVQVNGPFTDTWWRVSLTGAFLSGAGATIATAFAISGV